MPGPYTIELQPSARRFEAQPTDSILEAALRAGCNLDHRCANGTCGDCRVRILSGDSDQYQHHDFRIPAAERDQNVVLSCCHRALGDMVIQAREIGSSAEIPSQEIVARVARIEALPGEVKLLRVRTPRSRTLQFLAGQSLSLEFVGQPPRTLPIASCPCDGMNLRFHVDPGATGEFGTFVSQRLERNAQVTLLGPYGEFVLDDTSPRALLFIAWNTGFAPVESIIEHAVALELPQDITLYWLTRRADGHYQLNLCRAWEDGLDNFRFVALAAIPEDDSGVERLKTQIVDDQVELDSHDVYAAVPSALAEPVRELLVALGANTERLKVLPLPGA